MAQDSAISARAGMVLKSLIETHVQDGMPVGSGTLAKVSQLDVSAATIRNIMADLEAAGYIASPHTSAGRIPTSAGYRFFVDSLLEVESLNLQTVERFRSELVGATGAQQLVHTASSLLSGVTQLAGVVSFPKVDSAVLMQLELLQLSESRVLAVLVMENGDVQNRILQLDRTYSKSELEQAGNYLTEQFSGLTLGQARQRLAEELESLRQDLNDLMQSVVELGRQALEVEVAEDESLVVEGQTHLMDYAELSDIEKLRQLFEVFNHKGELLHVLERCESARALQIYIGQESGNASLGDCALVTAPYSVNGEIVGVLGVIGPTRIAYNKVIPVVDMTARLLGAALKSS
ncbi:MAG: heat-inducible transcriptional repressor HrcA [bacterium]